MCLISLITFLQNPSCLKLSKDNHLFLELSSTNGILKRAKTILKDFQNDDKKKTQHLLLITITVTILFHMK